MSVKHRIAGFAVVVGLISVQWAAVAPAYAVEPGNDRLEHQRHSGPLAKQAPAPQSRAIAAAPSRPVPPPIIRNQQLDRLRSEPLRPRLEVVRPRYEAERRGGERRDHDRGRYMARGVGGAAIIGSIIAYSAYRGPNRDGVYARCDRDFADFDYDTGTFVNEDGDRETCPYLVY